jgi:hypothetical protein
LGEAKERVEEFEQQQQQQQEYRRRRDEQKTVLGVFHHEKETRPTLGDTTRCDVRGPSPHPVREIPETN